LYGFIARELPAKFGAFESTELTFTALLHFKIEFARSFTIAATLYYESLMTYWTFQKLKLVD
jgi:hypothetical protein